jgi:hypothetical protein
MSISDQSFYELHRKNGNLYVIKGKQDEFSSFTSLFLDENALSPEQAVSNWVRSWYNERPTTITITPVRDNVWLAAYTIVGMLGLQEFLQKRAKQWKEAADEKRQRSARSESFMYVKASILTEMSNIGYNVSDYEVKEALINVDYPDF